MNTTIWKFPLDLRDKQLVPMPPSARILTAQVQHKNGLILWAEVDPKHPARVHRDIRIIGTGNPLPDEPLTYIGTAQDGWLVWHVYEALP